MDGDSTNPDDSLIAQYATKLARATDWKFPWLTLAFEYECGKDHGTLPSDFLSFMADSVFHQSSQLMLRLPNGTYIPWSPENPRESQFRAVGQWLVLILRTRMHQYVPFPMFVWKFIAGGGVSVDDIIEADPTISTEPRPTMWDGTEIDATSRGETATARLNKIRHHLSAIRAGFDMATGLEEHPLFDGQVLSNLVQGEGLTLEQYRDMVVVTGPVAFQQQFWRVLARLSEQELSLLMFFVTGMKRRRGDIAGNANKPICVELDQSARSDMALPTAVTCKAMLKIPSYSSDEIAYQKIIFAIHNCPSRDYSPPRR
jgi:hypothetical protein